MKNLLAMRAHHGRRRRVLSSWITGLKKRTAQKTSFAGFDQLQPPSGLRSFVLE